jgi:hypothetical protein
MAKVKLFEASIEIEQVLALIIGQESARLRIGNDRSLFIGFGELLTTKSALGEAVHGKWEIGAYYNAWRIIQGKRIVCGIRDTVESIEELRKIAYQVQLGRCSGIRQLSRFDLRVELDNDTFIDILATTGDEDEVFHIFCPESTVITYSIADGWTIGRSDLPWK